MKEMPIYLHTKKPMRFLRIYRKRREHFLNINICTYIHEIRSNISVRCVPHKPFYSKSYFYCHGTKNKIYQKIIDRQFARLLPCHVARGMKSQNRIDLKETQKCLFYYSITHTMLWVNIKKYNWIFHKKEIFAVSINGFKYILYLFEKLIIPQHFQYHNNYLSAK